MATKRRILGFVVLAVTGIVCPLRGDGRDDLSRGNSDYNALKSHYDDAKSKLEKYLDESVKLRAMDKDQLNDLITQMCRLDQKRDDDEVDRLDKELKDKVVDRVKREYDHTVDDGSRVFDDPGHLESLARCYAARPATPHASKAAASRKNTRTDEPSLWVTRIQSPP